MRTALIADIHGNLPALQSVMERIDRLDIDRIICLGDTVGYYPFVNECIGIVRGKCEFSVMGNHDLYLTGKAECPRSGTVRLTIGYQRGIITDDALAWLGSLPDHFSDDQMYICHGGPLDHIDQYLREPPYAFDADASIFASAHTHVPVVYTENGKIYVNPGSVGQPRDGDPRASFAVFDDDKTVRIERVPYDIDAVADASLRAGFDERLFGCLYRGTKIGG